MASVDYTDGGDKDEEQYCIDHLNLQSAVERTVYACENRENWVIRGQLTDEKEKRGVRLVKAGMGKRNGYVFW
jgi:hypothetical protein